MQDALVLRCWVRARQRASEIERVIAESRRRAGGEDYLLPHLQDHREAEELRQLATDLLREATSAPAFAR